MARKRLAIIGGGSSGLICLKYALDELPAWEIVCFEKTAEVTGCWGRPPQGFLSTSTKYTTQFACHVKYDATVAPHHGGARRIAEFFSDGEYGDYLQSFVATFQLDQHIRRNCNVRNMQRLDDGEWELTITHGTEEAVERFSGVVVCSGLADQPQTLPDCPIPTLRSIQEAAAIHDQTIVVVGGGESAVDLAQRLAEPQRHNEVYLSLRSGIRVSPRYHPIRDVPSDFLRNRLLLSIHPDIRNEIGQRFVEFRMKFAPWLRKRFPPRTSPQATLDPAWHGKRKQWDLALTRAAKDRLFNMYHNKSDDFLDSVAAGQITLVGSNTDGSFAEYFQFGRQETRQIRPDLIVPAIGYRSTLPELSGGNLALADFYLGCAHVQHDNVFAIGFTRPIIGNIPSISEMQARYVCGLLSKRFARPADLEARHEQARATLQRLYPNLDTVNVYPVEMFPYCDQLARLMNCYPSLQRAGSLSAWWRQLRAPATTMHYFDEHIASAKVDPPPIHAPALITLLLLIIKPFDLAYRLFR